MRNKIYYGWIIVLISVVVVSTLFGIRYSFGVFFQSFENDFGLSRTATSSIFSVSMLIAAIFAIISGFALDKYGPKSVVAAMGVFTALGLVLSSRGTELWHFYLSYSLLLSIGMGGAMPVMIATTSPWFQKGRGLAISIVSSGAGLGAAIIAPLAVSSIALWGWRTSYLLMGIFSLVAVSFFSVFLKLKPAAAGINLKNTDASFNSGNSFAQSTSSSIFTASLVLLRNRIFLMLLAIYVLFSFCLNMVMTHIVPHVTDIGLTRMEGASILSVISIAAVIGRIGTGPITDKFGRLGPCLASGLGLAITLGWLIFARQLWALYLFAAIFGLSWGGYGVMMLILVADLFGGRRIGLSMGIADSCFLIGAAIGPAFAGFLFDTTNSYVSAFSIALVLIVLSILLMVVAVNRMEARLNGNKEESNLA